eukprot:RCo045969
MSRSAMAASAAPRGPTLPRVPSGSMPTTVTSTTNPANSSPPSSSAVVQTSSSSTGTGTAGSGGGGTAPSIPAGLHVGKYFVDLSQELGRGGFGVVYRGTHRERPEEKVAVKVIALEQLPRSHSESLKTEIDLLKVLHHPNIVKYKDHEEAKGKLYIIMEYMEGGSLAALVRRTGPLSETLAGQYLIQLLRGLAYLHSEGIVHRDIK